VRREQAALVALGALVMLVIALALSPVTWAGVANSRANGLANPVPKRAAKGAASEVIRGAVSDVAKGAASDVVKGAASEVVKGAASEVVKGAASEEISEEPGQPSGEPHVAGPVPGPVGAAGAIGPEAALAGQLADEVAVTERARAAVTGKLADARRTQIRRMGAAVRLLHAVPGDDAMAVARRRAAARLLLERDRGEAALLAEEAAQLGVAHDRIAGEAARLPEIALPVELLWPARGKIVRHFGTLVHERSKAMLSRRGIDLEVDDHCAVTAPAAGTVRYAGPIRGLDHGVILDHGAYLTVIAKLGEVALPVGAPVAAGDRLGRAARHRVYVEVRVKLGPGGLPIDPEPLLAKR
jgi:murein hydrolase activator